MTESNDLFQLIKSLTKNEKGYFKKYSRINSNDNKNNYVRLFDAIDKQKEYDEEKIKRLFYAEKFIKQLFVTKHYLYRMILKSLESYDTGIDAELRSNLIQASKLSDKMLFGQAEKLLLKVKETAIKHERYALLVELFDLELRLERRSGNYVKLKYFLDEGFDKIQEKLDILKNRYEYEKLAGGLYYLQGNERYIRSKDTLKQFQVYANNELLKNPNKALSGYSKIRFYFANSYYYLSTGNLLKSITYRKKLVLFIEEKPSFLLDNYINAYVPAVANLCIAYTELKKYKEALRTINKLNILEAESALQKALIFNFFTSCSIDIYYKSKDYTSAIRLINNIEPLLIESKISIDNKQLVMIYFDAALVYFFTNDFKKALVWLNKILNNDVKEIFNQEYSFAKILNLLIHFELGNEELLESTVKSTYRFLSKKNILYKFEEEILDFIRKSFKINSQKELIVQLKKLNYKMISLLRDPQEKRVIELFQFNKWLENKIRSNSFPEIISRRH